MDDLTLNIYIISRCTHTHYARELKKLGLTMGQFPFVMGIVADDGISQERLSARLGISKSTTAAVVRQLLEKELISREVDSGDRRNFKLHATPAALALAPKIEAVIADCHRRITSGMDARERATFGKLLRGVRRCAEADLGGRGGAKKS